MNWVIMTIGSPATLNTGLSPFAGVGAMDNGSKGTTIRVFRCSRMLA